MRHPYRQEPKNQENLMSAAVDRHEATREAQAVVQVGNVDKGCSCGVKRANWNPNGLLQQGDYSPV